MLWTDDELTGADFATRARFIERFRDSYQIIPVADATARAQLVTETASYFTPSAANPLYVYRQDAPAWARVEFTTDGTTWTPVNVGADSGWVPLASIGASWDTKSANVRSRLVGNRVYLRGLFQPDDQPDGSSTPMIVGTHGSIATLAAGHRPPLGSTYHFPVVTWINGGTPPRRSTNTISISDTGVLSAYATGECTGFWVDGVSFLTD